MLLTKVLMCAIIVTRLKKGGGFYYDSEKTDKKSTG